MKEIVLVVTCVVIIWWCVWNATTRKPKPKYRVKGGSDYARLICRKAELQEELSHIDRAIKEATIK